MQVPRATTVQGPATVGDSVVYSGLVAVVVASSFPFGKAGEFGGQ